MNKNVLSSLLLSVILISLLDAFWPGQNPHYKDQVAVLMYHHVHDTDESSSTVSSDLFKQQLAYLKSRDFHFITLGQFKQFLQGAPIPDNAALVTFDDGYKSFYDNAYPILKELDIPAVNFIVTGDLEDPLASSIPSLSRDEVKEMVAYRPGMFDIQCHSDNLHYKIGKDAALTGTIADKSGIQESPDQYKQRILNDSKACAKKLDELYGRTHAADSYAYPFGIYTPSSQDLVRQAGFGVGFTIVSEMATRKSSSMEIPRINAGNPLIKPENLYKQILLRVEQVNR